MTHKNTNRELHCHRRPTERSQVYFNESPENPSGTARFDGGIGLADLMDSIQGAIDFCDERVKALSGSPPADQSGPSDHFAPIDIPTDREVEPPNAVDAPQNGPPTNDTVLSPIGIRTPEDEARHQDFLASIQQITLDYPSALAKKIIEKASQMTLAEMEDYKFILESYAGEDAYVISKIASMEPKTVKIYAEAIRLGLSIDPKGIRKEEVLSIERILTSPASPLEIQVLEFRIRKAEEKERRQAEEYKKDLPKREAVYRERIQSVTLSKAEMAEVEEGVRVAQGELNSQLANKKGKEKRWAKKYLRKNRERIDAAIRESCLIIAKISKSLQENKKLYDSGGEREAFEFEEYAKWELHKAELQLGVVKSLRHEHEKQSEYDDWTRYDGLRP